MIFVKISWNFNKFFHDFSIPPHSLPRRTHKKDSFYWFSQTFSYNFQKFQKDSPEVFSKSTHFLIIKLLKSVLQIIIIIIIITIWQDFNNLFESCSKENNELCLDHLEGIDKPDIELLKPVADYRFTLEANFYKFTEEELYRSNTYHRHYRMYKLKKKK